MKKLLSALFGRRATATPSQSQVLGTVKWFSSGQGFGFIEVAGENEPYFAHHTQIVAEGFRCLRGGQGVVFEPSHRPGGRQAKAIRVQPS